MYMERGLYEKSSDSVAVRATVILELSNRKTTRREQIIEAFSPGLKVYTWSRDWTTDTGRSIEVLYRPPFSDHCLLLFSLSLSLSCALSLSSSRVPTSRLIRRKSSVVRRQCITLCVFTGRANSLSRRPRVLCVICPRLLIFPLQWF